MLKPKINKSVNKVLETLLAIKETMHETTEPSVIQGLDEAISQIQQMQRSDKEEGKSYILLNCLNIAFKALPSIVELIKSLIE